MAQWKGYLQLMRPANLLTALADILGGIFITYGLLNSIEIEIWWQQHLWSILFLSLSSTCLYAAGVVLNDYFDSSLDAVERPQRPIPSGMVPANHALILGITLLITGGDFSILCYPFKWISKLRHCRTSVGLRYRQ